VERFRGNLEGLARMNEILHQFVESLEELEKPTVTLARPRILLRDQDTDWPQMFGASVDSLLSQLTHVGRRFAARISFLVPSVCGRVNGVQPQFKCAIPNGDDMK
jgi:hypothetical protein